MMNFKFSDDPITREFYIPTYILAPDVVGETESIPDVPSCPVLVFINSKSGGQLGGELLVTFRSLLNKYQVLSYSTFCKFIKFSRFMIELTSWALKADASRNFRSLIWEKKHPIRFCVGCI